MSKIEPTPSTDAQPQSFNTKVKPNIAPNPSNAPICTPEHPSAPSPNSLDRRSIDACNNAPNDTPNGQIVAPVIDPTKDIAEITEKNDTTEKQINFCPDKSSHTPKTLKEKIRNFFAKISEKIKNFFSSIRNFFNKKREEKPESNIKNDDFLQNIGDPAPDNIQTSQSDNGDVTEKQPKDDENNSEQSENENENNDDLAPQTNNDKGISEEEQLDNNKDKPQDSSTQNANSDQEKVLPKSKDTDIALGNKEPEAPSNLDSENKNEDTPGDKKSESKNIDHLLFEHSVLDQNGIGIVECGGDGDCLIYSIIRQIGYYDNKPCSNMTDEDFNKCKKNVMLKFRKDLAERIRHVHLKWKIVDSIPQKLGNLSNDLSEINSENNPIVGDIINNIFKFSSSINKNYELDNFINNAKNEFKKFKTNIDNLFGTTLKKEDPIYKKTYETITEIDNLFEKPEVMDDDIVDEAKMTFAELVYIVSESGEYLDLGIGDLHWAILQLIKDQTHKDMTIIAVQNATKNGNVVTIASEKSLTNDESLSLNEIQNKFKDKENHVFIYYSPACGGKTGHYQAIGKFPSEHKAEELKNSNKNGKNMNQIEPQSSTDAQPQSSSDDVSNLNSQGPIKPGNS